MVEIVYLAPGEEHPDTGDDAPWITVDATSEGLFYGTGGAWKADGSWVGFCSLPEDDVSLELALKAASEWAQKYNVPTIWVQLEP